MQDEIRRQRRILYIQSVLIFVLMGTVLLVSGLQVMGAAGLAVVLATAGFFVAGASEKAGEVRPGNAVPISPAHAPQLYSVLEELTARAELPRRPQPYLLKASLMNAAMLGNRKNPVLVVTPMLLQTLRPAELKAVLAHEIAHLRDNDLFSYRLAEAISMITMVISRVGWLLLVLYMPILLVGEVRIPITIIAVLLGAPVVSVLLQMALSRSRELAADLGAVELTGQPMELASALQKIDNVGRSMLHQVLPVPRKRESSVFRSHPVISQRVERLSELSETSS
ncbi:MAG: zinc metalloprotease HtpX [Spirochaetota bacterium]